MAVHIRETSNGVHADVEDRSTGSLTTADPSRAASADFGDESDVDASTAANTLANTANTANTNNVGVGENENENHHVRKRPGVSITIRAEDGTEIDQPPSSQESVAPETDAVEEKNTSQDRRGSQSSQDISTSQSSPKAKGIRRISQQFQNISSMVSGRGRSPSTTVVSPNTGAQFTHYKTSKSMGSPKFGRKRDRSQSVGSLISSFASHSVASVGPSAPRFKLLSLNFFLRPPFVAESSSGDWKEERLELFLNNEIQKYDIIAFQETFAFGTSRRDRLIKGAYVKGFKYSTACKTYSFFKMRIDGGLVILSRFPITRKADITFGRGTQIGDWFAAKGVIYAQINLPLQRDPSKLPSNFKEEPLEIDVSNLPNSSNDVVTAFGEGGAPNITYNGSTLDRTESPNPGTRQPSQQSLSSAAINLNNNFPAFPSVLSGLTASSDVDTHTVRLHLFTTHLQSGEGIKIMEIRHQQMLETKEFVDKVLEEEGRTHTEPVIFCGDFNVNARPTEEDGVGHSEEWTDMTNILAGRPTVSFGTPYNLGDVGYETFGEHVITTNKLQVGDGHAPADKKCIDFFFTLRSSSREQELESNAPRPQEYSLENFHVEPFKTNGMPFNFLSDHHGIVMDLVFRKERQESIIRRVPGFPTEYLN